MLKQLEKVERCAQAVQRQHLELLEVANQRAEEFTTDCWQYLPTKIKTVRDQFRPYCCGQQQQDLALFTPHRTRVESSSTGVVRVDSPSFVVVRRSSHSCKSATNPLGRLLVGVPQVLEA